MQAAHLIQRYPSALAGGQRPLTEGAAGVVSITPLLKRLWPAESAVFVTAEEIAAAVALIFTDQLSPVQTGALLTALHFTGLDRRADVLATCAAAMRRAAAAVDYDALSDVISRRGRKEGSYLGGLCDIVGTGGDSHNTFNVSTTASILCSPILLIAKHGNRASTSASGSADLLLATDPSPRLDAVIPATLTALYERTNYAFLFAPAFHPAMRFVAPVRTQLGWRTIFNLLGPLAHPAHEAVEARVVGVARKDLGASFAEALGRAGVRRALVVCGDEDLDEISCAGPTHCWALGMGRPPSRDAVPEDPENPRVDYFTLSPVDFGLLSFPLSAMTPGRTPQENAVTLGKILSNELPRDDPVLTFVLMNAAALLVVSGVCDANTSAMGTGDDGAVDKERGPGWGRWKEGVRRARWAVESGAAVREWGRFVESTIAVGADLQAAG